MGTLILSDSEIRKAQQKSEVVITPFDPARIQPASYDLALGDRFLWHLDGPGPIDPSNEQAMVADSGPCTLPAGGFVLAGTVERVALGPTLAAMVNGKSSLARLGLSVHQTAGWIDPGFGGAITLELFNHSGRPIKLWPGMLIAQLVLCRVEGFVEKLYGKGATGSRYHGQDAPAASKSFVGFCSDFHP